MSVALNVTELIQQTLPFLFAKPVDNAKVTYYGRISFDDHTVMWHT